MRKDEWRLIGGFGQSPQEDDGAISSGGPPGIPFGHTRFEVPAKHLPVEDCRDPAWVRYPLQAHRAASMPPPPPDHDSTCQ